MNSIGLVEETRGFERRVARALPCPGQRHGWRDLTRKARQQLQRVQSLESLRRWLPTVAGMVGVAYGVISLRGMHQTNAHAMALTTPGTLGRLRVFPAIALNMGGLALILIGSRLHGHWFIRVVRHSPAQSIMVAGEVSCQPLWISAQQEQEGDTISEALSATSY
jgi:hypothetical protein